MEETGHAVESVITAILHEAFIEMNAVPVDSIKKSEEISQEEYIIKVERMD